MDNTHLKPDYLFEVSWEVCNKVGGIHTVLATKALTFVKEFRDRFIFIGPELWREQKENTEFIEDPNLFKTWRLKAMEDGLRVRVGRWNIIGNPVVFLVDFSPFIYQKDEIFSALWESYKLDSISGQWDYIEPTVFGYTVGRVIESFYKYNLSVRDKVVAHFHQWMTGSAMLYIKEHTPQIGTIFTSHATVVGRAIAGNKQHLYIDLHQYNGETKAREFNIVSKQSLEKISAQNADCFSTISEITAKECKQLLETQADITIPNGFEDDFVPIGEEFTHNRESARQKLKKVSESILGYEISPNAKFIGTGGRYEFRNKGLDIFIDSIGEVRENHNLQDEVIAFILVPADNYGPRKDLQDKLNSTDSNYRINGSKYLTHNLHDEEFDPILHRIKEVYILNNKEDKVKIIFVPCYLNGNDGIFNMTYYDILIGLDLTIFPSYYEPWGYTPLESLAFRIPTVTTDLSGFGQWMLQSNVDYSDCLFVVERNDENHYAVVKKIAEIISSSLQKSETDRIAIYEKAHNVSKVLLWKNIVGNYFEAFSIALNKLTYRADTFEDIKTPEKLIDVEQARTNDPVWRNIQVQPNLTGKFLGLEELSRNLWWSWNTDATNLWDYIGNNNLWKDCRYNPVWLLKEISFERLTELEKDEVFISMYESVYNRFREYMDDAKNAKTPKIAYFSMEYGLHDTLKIFSGGLGILAGDYLKEASDSNVNMVGVGFLYKHGYFHQQLSPKGEQLVIYEPQQYSHLPILPVRNSDGSQVTVRVAFPGRIVSVGVWRANVGRIPLYLLDTDINENLELDRTISHQLYGGDAENRLKQEIVLGIGGIRALDAMGVEQDLYHCNEGHAAFIGLERLHKLINFKNFTFAESLEIVRASTLFTTHTPVPAGHDAFNEDLIMAYLGHYPERLKISLLEFLSLGKANPNDKSEKFSMSLLAVSISQEVNGVSWLHGEVTKEMFEYLWKGYYADELFIGYVTNGVHYSTWAAKEWKELYEKEFGKGFLNDLSNKDYWSKIHKVSDKRIWEIKQNQRQHFVDYIISRLDSDRVKRRDDPKEILKIKSILNPNALTIGFARRFATYKRGNLLFRDLEMLAKLVNNPDMPIQFVYAGKAHPNDTGGQGIIKQIVEISKRPEFIGKIIFLENYDIQLAQRLVQGVDIWLNTPTRPLEASGTSGMKAVMNGVLNFSVLDGWWVEGYKKNAGWALDQRQTYQNEDFQNDLDSATIYRLLENEIAPMFYRRDKNNIPVEWVKYIKNCIAEIAPEFTTKRMIDDYTERFYTKLGKRSIEMAANDFEMAKKIASWKKRVSRGWDSIDVVSLNFHDTVKDPLFLGERYYGEVVLDLKELSDTKIGIEMIITESRTDGTTKIVDITELKLMKLQDRKAYYEIELLPPRPGNFNYGLRVFPKNESLPHRQDFCYIKWI